MPYRNPRFAQLFFRLRVGGHIAMPPAGPDRLELWPSCHRRQRPALCYRAGVPTVLVVDDNSAIVSALSEALTEEGWNVVAALSAKEAIAIAQSRNVDIVLCDVLLGESSDGLDLRDQFVRHALGHIPFAFVTASTREMARLKGELALRKPFKVSEVVELLNAALSRSQDKTSRGGADYPERSAGALARDPQGDTPGPRD